MGIFDPDVVRVKVLGVRTAMHSGVFSNVNYGVYSLLVEFKNGKRKVIEVEYDQMYKYAELIEWPYPD